MIEDSNIKKEGEDNYKLTPEWRKEWKTKNGIKAVKRKTRKPKDAPKGARNAYIFFGLDVRKRRQDQYPEKDAKEITKMIGEEWKGLSDKKRKKYEDEAAEDRKRYKRDMKAYKRKKREEESSGSEESSRSRSPRKKRHTKSRRDESESESKGKKKRKDDSSEESEKKDGESEEKKKRRGSDQGKEGSKNK